MKRLSLESTIKKFEPIEIVCPRCSKASQERLYGPCAACRAALHNIKQPDPDVIHFKQGEDMQGKLRMYFSPCDNECTGVHNG